MNVLLWTQQPIAVTAARWIVGLAFLAAAISKLPDGQQFAYVVLAYRVLPMRFATAYARLLPWLEAAVGCMLMVGLASGIAGAIGALLLASFTAAVGLNVVRGRHDLHCGCFGTRYKQRIGGKVIARNAVLMLLALQVSLAGAGSFTTKRSLAPGAANWIADSAQGALALAGCNLALLLLYPLLRQGLALRLSKRRPVIR